VETKSNSVKQARHHCSESNTWAGASESNRTRASDGSKQSLRGRQWNTYDAPRGVATWSYVIVVGGARAKGGSAAMKTERMDGSRTDPFIPLCVA
jgi:hypothetical protein